MVCSGARRSVMNWRTSFSLDREGPDVPRPEPEHGCRGIVVTRGTDITERVAHGARRSFTRAPLAAGPRLPRLPRSLLGTCSRWGALRDSHCSSKRTRHNYSFKLITIVFTISFSSHKNTMEVITYLSDKYASTSAHSTQQVSRTK